MAKPIPPGAVMVGRGRNHKIYEWTDAISGQKKRRVSTSVAPTSHWKDSAWQDLDPAWVRVGNRWEAEKVPYHIEATGPGVYQFTSDIGERVDVDSGLSVSPSNKPLIDGKVLIWRDVAANLDVKMTLTPHGVDVFKILKGPGHPLSFSSTVILPVGSGLVLDRGGDDYGRDNVDRVVTAPTRRSLNTRRRLHVSYGLAEVDNGDGTKTITTTTDFILSDGGDVQVLVLDLATHLATPSTDVIYPLELRV